jgi:hypothetical protein
MALFGNTPLYYGEATGSTVCKRREAGFLAWLGELLGFPKPPCYVSPSPPCNDECPPDLCPPND